MKNTLTTIQTQEYKFCFESGDECIIDKQYIGLSSGTIKFIVDNYNYSLSISSDWGNYFYKGYPNSEETFKELLMRLSTSYLLNKISTPTVFDIKKSKKETIRYFFTSGYANYEDKKDRGYLIKQVYNIEDCEPEVFASIVYSLGENMFESLSMSIDYSIHAKLVVNLFKTYLVTELLNENKKEINNDN